MKNIFTQSALLSLVLFSSMAKADVTMINCDSIRGTQRSLTLVVFNQELKQVRVLSNGSRPRPLIPNKLINQNIEGVTLYTLVGLPGFLQVENKVLEGNGGLIRLDSDEFSCF